LVPNPGYPTYTSAVKLAGAKPVFYDLIAANNYEPDFEILQTQVKEQNIKGLFINYPHMPTGTNGNIELFKKIIQFAKANHILVIHDNPYSFILNNQPLSILSVEGAIDVAVELNSLSKSHNMAGWRMGMLCGSKVHIDEVLKFKSNMDSGMFLPAQLAAAKALGLGEEWFEGLNKIYAERRLKVFALLDLLGCIYNKNQVGMFVWASVPSSYKDGYTISDEVLYGANVFITPGGIFGDAGNSYIRISLCGSIEKFEEAIIRVSKLFTS
jgi:LL-diaminopimelate aminotransferase